MNQCNVHAHMVCARVSVCASKMYNRERKKRAGERERERGEQEQEQERESARERDVLCLCFERSSVVHIHRTVCRISLVLFPQQRERVAELGVRWAVPCSGGHARGCESL